MPEKTLRQKTISGMIWVGFQKFGTLFITFLANIVLARLLTPDDYGLIGMLAIFIAISNTFIDGGFGSALIQKTHPAKEDYSTVFYWNIFLGFALYGILYLSSPLIESFYHEVRGLSTILRIQGIILIINAFSIVQATQLRKLMEFKLLAKVNVSGAIISSVFAIILAYNGWGVWSLVWQQIMLSCSNCILLWFVCKWTPLKKFSLSSLKSLFKFGSFMMMSSLVNTIGNNIYGLLIGSFFSAGTLGYFTQAKKIEDVSSVGLLSVIEQVTYPMLVEVKNDHKKMAIVLDKFNSSLMAVTMPLLLFLALVAEPIIVFLFSAKWLPSVPILQILTIYGIFICLQGCNYNVIAAIGKSKTIFKWTIYKRVFSIAILIIALYLFGFYGLLAGIVLTSVFIAGCNMYLVAKYIDYSLKKQIIGLAPVMLLSTIPFLLYFGLSEYTFLGYTIISKFLLGLLYLATYTAILLYIPINSIKQIRFEIKKIIISKI